MARDYVNVYRNLLRRAPVIGREEGLPAANVATVGTMPYAA